MAKSAFMGKVRGVPLQKFMGQPSDIYKIMSGLIGYLQASQITYPFKGE